MKTNNKKKGNTAKKLIPAAMMLAVSASMLGTSTYAWFTMNTTVTVQGMQMQARAENGIVVSNAAGGTYDATATSAKTTVAEIYPGSTKDLSTWLHSTSTNPGAANTQQTYTAGSAWTANTDSSTRGNYVVHDFYLRSSGATALSFTSLDITGVNATVSSSAPSQELSKALRVGIKVAGSQNYYIYAPVTGYTATVSVQNAAGAYSSASGDRTDVSALAGNTTSNDTSITSLPANTANGTHVEVFVWYEGEDAACKSDNIVASLEQISVSVNFGLTGAATS